MEYFLEVICNHGESGPFATTTARTSGFQTEGPSDKLFSYVLHAIYKHCCIYIYIYIFFLDALEIVFRVSKSCPSMSANQSHLDTLKNVQFQGVKKSSEYTISFTMRVTEINLEMDAA